MSAMHWEGVMPAITTPFDENLAVDHDFLASHVKWLVDHDCTGIVALGSLGEGATLSFDEKRAILETCVSSIGERVPVVAGISALGTAEAVSIAEMAKEVGCKGLMVLPPYVYQGSWREMRTHFGAIMEATDLSCMLYNNPIAYGVDVQPEQIVELAHEHSKLHAVKESSGDIRRIAEIRRLYPHIDIFVGIDDLIVEGVHAGAVGWIAGLVNALPAESVQLFNLARDGGDARKLYEWFLPLLRLDTTYDFVQLVKLVQQEAGMGNERVRPPRLTIDGAYRKATLDLIKMSLASRPTPAATG